MDDHNLRRIQNKIYRQTHGESKKTANKRWYLFRKLTRHTFTKEQWLCSEILEIQPMEGPVGIVYYLNKYEK